MRAQVLLLIVALLLLLFLVTLQVLIISQKDSGELADATHTFLKECSQLRYERLDVSYEYKLTNLFIEYVVTGRFSFIQFRNYFAFVFDSLDPFNEAEIWYFCLNAVERVEESQFYSNDEKELLISFIQEKAP